MYKNDRKNNKTVGASASIKSSTASKGGESLSQEVVSSPISESAHIEPVQAIPLEVKVYNDNFDKALRAFRALVQKERILSVWKEKQTYEKPSQKRRRKRNDRKRKLMELDRKFN